MQYSVELRVSYYYLTLANYIINFLFALLCPIDPAYNIFFNNVFCQ